MTAPVLHTAARPASHDGGMADELLSTTERTVLVSGLTALVAWIAAQWRTARSMKNSVGDSITTLSNKLDAATSGIEKRLDGIEQAAATARETAAKDALVHTQQTELRVAPIERAVFGPNGLEAQMRLTTEQHHADRLHMSAMQQQLAQIAQMLAEVRSDVRRALERSHPTGD